MKRLALTEAVFSRNEHSGEALTVEYLIKVVYDGGNCKAKHKFKSYCKLQGPLRYLDGESLECISGKLFWIQARWKNEIRINKKPAN